MPVKVLAGSLVIFFGTLLAAGLVALGQPGDLGVPILPLAWPFGEG